jgi:hypothetical protein
MAPFSPGKERGGVWAKRPAGKRERAAASSLLCSPRRRRRGATPPSRPAPCRISRRVRWGASRWRSGARRRGPPVGSEREAHLAVGGGGHGHGRSRWSRGAAAAAAASLHRSVRWEAGGNRGAVGRCRRPLVRRAASGHLPLPPHAAPPMLPPPRLGWRVRVTRPDWRGEARWSRSGGARRSVPVRSATARRHRLLSLPISSDSASFLVRAGGTGLLLSSDVEGMAFVRVRARNDAGADEWNDSVPFTVPRCGEINCKSDLSRFWCRFTCPSADSLRLDDLLSELNPPRLPDDEPHFSSGDVHPH